GVAEGDSVPPEFDSMIAKIIAHGDTREQAIARLRRAVADTMVSIEEGTTNQGFLLELLGRPELRKGEVDTGWLDRLQAAGEVQAGDGGAVTESREMESSLTATVRGRVREVLVSATSHVPAGKPLLQIDPLDEEAGGDEGERIRFDVEAGDGETRLADLEWL